MPSDLVQFFKDEGYFEKIPLNELHGNCCSTSTVPVIPFNRIKDKFYEISGGKKPKTVNALLFFYGTLIFIQTEQYYIASSDYPLEKFHELLQSRDIPDKIEGTVSALSEMVVYYQLGADFKSYFTSPVREKIKTIILTELTDQDFLKLRIASLDKLNIISDNALLGEIVIMVCDDFQNKFE